MAYSEDIAQRIRLALAGVSSVEEKKMFGGLAFLVNGKMCINAGQDRLMVRIDPAIHDEVLQKNGCRPVMMGGREYKGFVYVSEAVLRTEEGWDYWIGLALDFNKRARASTKRKKK